MGGTPLLELYLLYNEVDKQLRAAGLDYSYDPCARMIPAAVTVSRSPDGH